jgi:carbon monoxide dehydrogenase subunit G
LRGADFSAEADVPASAEEVFDFLSDLEKHWALTGPRIEVLELDGPLGARTGGRVRIVVPPGLGRTARTEVLEARRPLSMAGRAEIGSRTVARVRWEIAPLGEGCRVRLQATVERAGGLDLLILALGGRRVMRSVFRHAVGELGRVVAGRSSGSGAPHLDVQVTGPEGTVEPQP